MCSRLDAKSWELISRCDLMIAMWQDVLGRLELGAVLPMLGNLPIPEPQ